MFFIVAFQVTIFLMNSFEISFDDKRNVVRATVVGEMLQADGEKVITAARKTAAEKGCNIIYDIRQATTKVAFAEWYHLPRKLEVFKQDNARQIKAAVLASPEDKAISGYKFYETVTDNLGFKLRLFFDESEAIAWLFEESSVKPQNYFVEP